MLWIPIKIMNIECQLYLNNSLYSIHLNLVRVLYYYKLLQSLLFVVI